MVGNLGNREKKRFSDNDRSLEDVRGGNDFMSFSGIFSTRLKSIKEKNSHVVRLAFTCNLSRFRDEISISDRLVVTLYGIHE